jgi:EmrB/QacA subfamily drug resistance transporter
VKRRGDRESKARSSPPACLSAAVQHLDAGADTGDTEALTSGEPTFTRPERLVIAASAISILIVQMDWFALNLAVPAIARDFDVPSTDLQWVISGYMLSIGALMVTAGRLADIFGRRRIIVIGLVVFGVLSAICGAAQDENWLIVARVVQGVGAALIFPVSIAVVASTFTGPRQSRAIGIVLGFAAIGTALGPFIGGTFSEHASWRGVFLINIPFCIVAVILMLRYVKETRDEHAERHIDVPGVLTITAALAAISLAFDKGADWGWGSLAMIGTLVGGLLLIAVFVRIESRVRAPLIDLDLFRNRAFDAVVVAGSISNVVFCLVAVFSALYLQQARGLPPFDSGLIFLALSAGAGGASYWSGRLAERFPADRLMAIGMLISAGAIVLLTSVDSLWVYTPIFLVCGIGLGLGWALVNVATQAVVPTQMAGAASGIALTSLVMLGAVAVAIGAAVLEVLSGSASTAASDADALDTVMRAGAVLGLAGAAGLLLYGRQRGPKTAPEPVG